MVEYRVSLSTQYYIGMHLEIVRTCSLAGLALGAANKTPSAKPSCQAQRRTNVSVLRDATLVSQ